MHRYLLLLSLLLLLKSVPLSAQNQDTYIQSLITNQRYFELDRNYEKTKAQLSEYMQLKAQSTLNAYFNNPQAALSNIKELLAKYQPQLGEESDHYLMLLGSLYAETYQYAEAYHLYRTILNQTGPFGNRDNHRELEQNMMLFNTLSHEVPFSFYSTTDTCPIPFRIDSLNSMYIPVTVHQQKIDFLFDTGNTACLVTEKKAKELGIRILPDSSWINNYFYAQTGLLDSMQIGSIIFKQILFYILPDSNLQVPLALGLPIIRCLNAITINNENNTIKILKPEPFIPQTRNMMIIHNLMFFEAKSQFEPLIFRFDTGDNSGSLYASYYRKHTHTIQKLGIPSSNFVQHAGGQYSIDGYTLSSFPITINNQFLTLPQLFVEKSNENMLGALPVPCDGSLGMILLRSCKEITLNFNNSCINCVHN